MKNLIRISAAFGLLVMLCSVALPQSKYKLEDDGTFKYMGATCLNEFFDRGTYSFDGKFLTLISDPKAGKITTRGDKDITSQEPVSSSTSLKTVVAKMEFVPIAPGTFEMGSKAGWGELKLHKVTLTRGFEMGRYEVTQAEWESIMGNNPSVFVKQCGKNCPVENVTWEEVQEFISKLNEIKDGYIYRLPTEAEWEYACRAGLSGDFEGDLDEMGWFMTNSGFKTHEVGKKRANDWGLYDMYGNVFEFVSDWYSNEAIDGVKDPTGPKTGRVHMIRGGSWGIDKNRIRASISGTSGERQIQPSYRTTAWGPRHPHVGFRLVRTPFQ